jgi:hypothetical protein
VPLSVLAAHSWCNWSVHCRVLLCGAGAELERRGLALSFKGQADHCCPALQEYKVSFCCNLVHWFGREAMKQATRALVSAGCAIVWCNWYVICCVVLCGAVWCWGEAARRGLALSFKGQADHCCPALQEYKVGLCCCRWRVVVPVPGHRQY